MTQILSTYPDEYIEHWGNVFLANPIVRRRGGLFAALVYPLAVCNVATAAMNLAAELGAPKVTAAIVGRI